ncbi:MAG: DMT family transporter [bacterium]|nr:DMT family transporter [bacterium]
MRFYVLAITVTFLWGLSFTTVKIGLQGMGPFTFLWLRSLISALTVFFLIRMRGGKFMPPKGSRDFWWNTLLHNLVFLLFYNGAAFTTAGRASLFLYGQPIFYTALAAWLMPAERIGVRGVAGFSAAAIGMVLLFNEKLAATGPTWLGDAIILVSAFVWGVQSLFLKVRLKGHDAFQITAWVQLVAVVLFLPIALAKGEGWPDLTNLYVLTGAGYNGIVGTGITQVLWVILLAQYSPSRVSAYMFLCPVFGVFLGALILQEVLGLPTLAGAALIAAGIYLVNTRRMKGAGEIAASRPD